MTAKILKIVVIQSLVIKVLTSHVQPSIRQYLHVTGVGPHAHSPGLSNLPTVGVTSHQVPSYTSRPQAGLPAFSALSLPSLISGLSQSPSPAALPLLASVPSASIPNFPLTDNSKKATTEIDSAALNNLAIALQLLILSNIFNISPSETAEAEEIFETTPSSFPHKPSNKLSPSTASYDVFDPFATSVSYAPKPKSISHPTSASSKPSTSASLIYPSQSTSVSNAVSSSYSYEKPRYKNPSYYSYDSSPAQPSHYSAPSLENSNYLGSSGFVDSSPMLGFGSFGSYGSAPPNPRSSMTLMSPYEALGPNSPFSDPILSSPYGSHGSKKDFQSPYAAILADDNNLFSVKDLF